MISWKGNLVPSLSTIVSLSVLNNVELCYRGTGTSWSRGGGSVIAAFFLAHNYVSEQFGNYVEYGIFNLMFRPSLFIRFSPSVTAPFPNVCNE